MRIASEKIYLRYRRRPQWQVCPNCNAGIRWIYCDGSWVPCDEAPVMYVSDAGSDLVFCRRTPRSKAKILNTAEDFEKALLAGEAVNTCGFVPHVFTCREKHNWKG